MGGGFKLEDRIFRCKRASKLMIRYYRGRNCLYSRNGFSLS